MGGRGASSMGGGFERRAEGFRITYGQRAYDSLRKRGATDRDIAKVHEAAHANRRAGMGKSDALSAAMKSFDGGKAKRSATPKAPSGYSRRDYDSARAAGFGHDESVARAKAAAKQRAKFRSQGNRAKERSFEEVTSGTWEREKKSRARAASGWLTGDRGRRKR